MEFEWDENKAESNLRKHGVSFEEATEAFYDEFCLDIYDDAHSEFDKNRFLLLGLSRKGVLVVAYVVREAEVNRIITARKAVKHEQDEYWNERIKYQS